jgi:hypothetical protein
MGCCLPSRVSSYTPINSDASDQAAASSLRAGRWSPISYGKKTWALGADGTLSRPAAYVHPALWQTMAGAEQDEKAWKKAHRRSRSAAEAEAFETIGEQSEEDEDEESQEDAREHRRISSGPQSGPLPSAALAIVDDEDAPDSNDSVRAVEDAPLLPALAPSARGAAAIARAAERQRAAAAEAGTALPPGSAAATAPALLAGVSDEQRAAEEAFAKKAARKQAKKEKKRVAAAAAAAAAATAGTLTLAKPSSSSQQDEAASAPSAPPRRPPPPPPRPSATALQQEPGFIDTNWGTADVGLLPENWTAHRDPSSGSFYYFNERTLKVRKTHLARHFILKMRSFYQDRLGTNIGETQK